MCVITYEEFARLEMRIGKVLAAERVPGAEKLLRLEVDVGMERRQLVAGIAESYAPEQLAGKEIVVLTNLKPKVIRGVESQGMLLAVDAGGKSVLLTVDSEVPVGSIVR